MPFSPPPADTEATQPSQTSAQGILLPLCTLVSCLLLVAPLIAQVQRRNLPASVLFTGLVIVNMLNTINALVWREDNQGRWWNGHILCDIEIKLYIGIGQIMLGVPACVFRQLARILDPDQITTAVSPSQKRTQRWFDFTFCFALPVYLMAVHYVVQPTRYEIASLAGCLPRIDRSWVVIPLMLIWSPLTLLVSISYGLLTGFRLIKHRRDISSVLANSSSDLDKSRYFRLFVLSVLLVIVYAPLATLAFVRNVYEASRHSYSWSAVHPANWSKLINFSSYSWTYTATRWAQAGAGMVCSVFFGLNQDSVAQYRAWLASIVVLRESLASKYCAAYHSRSVVTTNRIETPLDQGTSCIPEGVTRE